MNRRLNYIRRKLLMILPRKFHFQYIRSYIFTKKCFLIIICLLFLVYIVFLNQKDKLCDPTEHLWWFCSWPDPQKTVCSWADHFPKTLTQIPSPELYNELLSSYPKLRSSFEYNNLTLVKCSEESIDLLIFVISKCSHFSIRQSIRRTWGNTKLLQEFYPKLQLKLLFLVDIDSKSEKKIELEHQYHNDIVQISNLPEQYEYVTEREGALYEFIQNRCQQSKYIFKSDDDIFINTYLLLSFLNENLNSLEKYSLIGFPIEHGLVVRHTQDYVGQRYIVTKDEYQCSRYPTFLSGFGYLLSFHTLSLLSKAYFTDRKPFPLSDVYFTGLLPEIFHIPRKTIFQNVEYRYQMKCNEQFFTGETNPLACAASDDHFSHKESGGDRSFMNDYNFYWMKLTEKYHLSRTTTRK